MCNAFRAALLGREAITDGKFHPLAPHRFMVGWRRGVAGRLNRVGGGRAAFRAVCRRGSLVLALVGAGCGGKAVLDDAEMTSADASEDWRDGSVDATGSGDEPSDGNPRRGRPCRHRGKRTRRGGRAGRRGRLSPFDGDPQSQRQHRRRCEPRPAPSMPLPAPPGSARVPPAVMTRTACANRARSTAWRGQGEPCADCTASGRVCRFQTCV